MRRVSTLLAFTLWLTTGAWAADFSVPGTVVAGDGLTITTAGSGSEELLVFGPATGLRKQVRLGGPVTLGADEISRAGEYVLVLGGTAKTFTVQPGAARHVNFLARPSRVPVATPNVVIGVVFVFDARHNLALAPAPVRFTLRVNDSVAFTETRESKNGYAWVRTGSGPREGAAQFTATLAGEELRRVVQQVASDPCSIRMRATRAADQLALETDPIRDCSGNPVPDGTIVSFTQIAPDGKRSTVDARIKQGVAKAAVPAIAGARIQVASGVVLGNEIKVGGGGR